MKSRTRNRKLTEGQRAHLLALIESDPVSWIETHFYIPEPRCPLTGAFLGQEGRIRIAPYQQRVIREALSKDDSGNFKYSTILWSEPKKTGKTTCAAAVTLYNAATNDNVEVYCLANDGKQSEDRIFAKVRSAVSLNKKHNGILSNANIARGKITFPNGSFIEAIPCDPSGEAGGEPTFTAFSEMQGYMASQTHKMRLWAELTIPPTKYGRAQRWVESYAGYEGESVLLEQLYQTGITSGTPHPDFQDLPVRVNPIAQMLAFWSHEGRHPWHTSEYYAQEAMQLTDGEFRRMHRNEWVSSKDTFVRPEWWDACREDLSGYEEYFFESEPIVLAMDAAVSGDCFAIVGVSRHPDPERADTDVAVRFVQVWVPPKGGKLDFVGTDDNPGPEMVVRNLCNTHNVVQVAYDPYQLHDMATRLSRESVAWFKEFTQGARRLEADAQLRQLILHKRIAHQGEPDLNAHIGSAAAETDKDDYRRLRIVKKSDEPIDAVVALSMATCRVLELNL